MKFIAISLFKFAKDLCYLRASALTFYSLLALVPAIAITMIIAQVLGLEDNLEALLQNQMTGQETTVKYLLKFASNLIYESRNSIVAGIGSVLILGSIYKMFLHIRYNINGIWYLDVKNSIMRVIVTFTTVSVFIPTTILLTSAINVYIFTVIHSQVTQLYNRPELLGLLSIISSYFLITTLFTWIYMVIPQTKVKLKAAIASGLITAAIHVTVQKVFIWAQIYMVNQSVIFGSFAAIPLLMSWLQIVWMTILYGSVLTYVIQYKPESSKDLYISSHTISEKIQLLSSILDSIYSKEEQGDHAPSSERIHNDTGIPLSIVEQSLHIMLKAKIIAKMYYHGENDPRYSIILKIKSNNDIRKIILNHDLLRI